MVINIYARAAVVLLPNNNEIKFNGCLYDDNANRICEFYNEHDAVSFSNKFGIDIRWEK